MWDHSYIKYIDNMMEEMQEYGKTETEDQKVLYPYVGLVCTAQHVKDGNFCRAQVMKEMLQEERMMVRVAFGSH